MADNVDAGTRSRMMSAIRGKDTKPEVTIRRYLHSKGFRFRLHRPDLPGKPDLVLAKYRLAIFVHGCFWHRHEGCFYATSPATRSDFWQTKLSANVERDGRQVVLLQAAGWRVMIIWECGLKLSLHQVDEIDRLIRSDLVIMEWPPCPPRLRSPAQSL
ncbi:very short patch repair endonuclease [Stutzerimonas stutzeri]|uniref:very short patch repair endonuclease n=1 Tax=Stutzerimonas stutzeri TaxID=316 RepID=UPI0011E8422B|nr:DNA mismatch endonuclease Vsr [Stutzerimonas stutzeri]